MHNETVELGEAFGNGYYRWQPIKGSVYTHLLTVLDTQKKDFGTTYMVHATTVKFPMTQVEFGILEGMIHSRA
jgi:hypothetical protein